MDIVTVINQMLVLLLMLLIGVIACKTGIITGAANATLSKIAINICQSSMVLASVMNVEPVLSGGELIWLVCVSFITYAILGAVAALTPLLLRSGKRDRGMYRFMTMFGNVAFIGFPVVGSIFGQEAVFYASLFNISFNILLYSLGIVFVGSGEEKSRFDWKKIVNAPMIALAISMIIFIFKIPVPFVIAETSGAVGNMVIPLSMFIIGSSLGNASLKEIFGQWRLYVFMPVKLIVCPVIVWAVLRLFVTNEIILGIATVLSAMPVAAISTMLAISYGGNESLASRGVFLTTVASVITIPFVVYLLLV